MIKKLTCTILLTLVGSIAFAQQHKIPFEKYGVAEGLPEEFVRGLLQDDKGFIWFGTQNGLAKYDGYHFKVFRVASDETDTANLQLRSLWGGLLKTKDGKIWMAGTHERGGITSFDPITEKFRNFYPAANATKGADESASFLLFEDEEGNIWFNYWSYLTRQFTTFRLNPTTGAMKEYPVGDINGGNLYLRSFGTVESSGNVWLLDNKKNLNKLNQQKDSFETIIPAGKDFLQSGKADTIRQLGKGTGNRLLLTGSHGLYFFDSKNQKIVKSFAHMAGEANGLADSILYAFEDLKGRIWVTHRRGKISLIDPITGNIQTFTYGSGPLTYQKDVKEIRNFWFTAQNKEGIWFNAMGNDSRPKFFIHYNFSKKIFSLYDYNFNLRTNPLPYNPGAPYLFLEDRTGMLWLGTRPGLYKQAPAKQQMDLFRYQADELNGLPSDSIRYLFEDSKKRLWIGTRNGLAIYQPGRDNFRVFRNDPTNAASLSNNSIRTVQEDADGKIWVGTENGLNQWQVSTGSFKRFFYNPIEINNCTFLFNDKQQRLWLSIANKGVFVLDKKTGRILKSYMPNDKNPVALTSKQIDKFYQDSRGNIWLGDEGDNTFGLYRLNQAEDGFVHYLPIPGDSSSISSNEITFLAEDGKKRLWIGTDQGLNLYHYDQNRFTRFMNSNLISIPSFTTDKQGEPWFGTYSSGGLVSVDAEKGIITAYGETKGLLQNDLTFRPALIPKDDFGRFWLPTQRGLSVFDPENKSFISYFEKDGFQPYDRRYFTIKTSNGDIWIGGNNGLNHILPANLLKKDTTLPSIVITQVTINDSLYSKPDGIIFKKSVAYTTEIELKYWQKDLSFDFVALHYLRTEDNQYSWKLENYDKDWSAPSKERKASYTNLSPGKYIFRVKASNADGVWSEEGIAINISILPPWWRTWWAYSIYGIMFLFMIYPIHIYQKSRVVKAQQEKARTKELAQAKEIEKAYTELKSAQSQLIQSEKMASLGQLTAGIAHEIQNPLNFVNNFSEVNEELLAEMKDELRNGKIDDALALADNVLENQKKINHHGKRADGIVKGMLQHSRSSSGVKEPTDINVLADEYLRLAFHGLRAKDKFLPDGQAGFNAKFTTDFDRTIEPINVMPQEIGRVILNLINNAFYAVTEKQKKGTEGYEPTVTVSTKNSGSSILISVKDNGNGIPQKILDKIFQPFFTTKPTGQGTGLGLSLSYDIVKAHGGELTVETREGEGSGFVVSLPV